MSVTLVNIEKRYDDGTHAVKDLSLEIAQGEFFTLLGPSGCGKTSTLRMIAGLEDVTAGAILINGRDVTGIDPGKRDVALVFQSYALYPHMTARENLTIGLRARGMARSEADTRAIETARLLGIEELLDKKPGKLSGGQRQRVALGRAIVRRPALFLMDEPLSNLDLKLREYMRTELKRLHERIGITTIYVTHDQSEALILSDRLAVMRDGVLQQVGPPTLVYEEPANRFVAEFIGSPSINFLSGEIVDGVVSLRGREIGRGDADGGGAVLVGVRPENVLLAAPGEGALNGVVELVEPNGAVLFVFIELEGGRLEHGRDHLIATVDAHRRARKGDRVSVRFREGQLRFFDPVDGRALSLRRSGAGTASVATSAAALAGRGGYGGAP